MCHSVPRQRCWVSHVNRKDGSEKSKKSKVIEALKRTYDSAAELAATGLARRAERVPAALGPVRHAVGLRIGEYGHAALVFPFTLANCPGLRPPESTDSPAGLKHSQLRDLASR